ncbi:MAG: hypothetical protein ACLTZN_03035 [Streptococcus sp.]
MLSATTDFRSPILPISPNCQALSGQINYDELLNEPQYLSATLIFLRSKESSFPNVSKTLELKLPAFTMDWLEILLQGLLFQVPTGQPTRRIRKATPHELKAAV